MIMKNILVFLLTTATILTASTAAMADSFVGNGSGGNHTGDYSYELWLTTDNTRYYLKIWKLESYKKGEPSWTTHSFESSRKALDYFDCNYTRKSAPDCPK